MSKSEDIIQLQAETFLTTCDTKLGYFRDSEWYHIVFGYSQHRSPLPADTTDDHMNVSSCDDAENTWHVILSPSGRIVQISLPNVLAPADIPPTLGLSHSAWGLVASLQLAPQINNDSPLYLAHPHVSLYKIDGNPGSIVSTIYIDHPDTTFPVK